MLNQCVDGIEDNAWLQWMIGTAAYEKRCPTHHPRPYSWQSTFTSLVACQRSPVVQDLQGQSTESLERLSDLLESTYGWGMTAPRLEPEDTTTNVGLADADTGGGC